MFNIGTIAFPSSYHIVLLSGWLLSLRNLFCSNGRQRGNVSGYERSWGGTRRSRRRGKCNQDIFYEEWSISYFLIKEKNGIYKVHSLQENFGLVLIVLMALIFITQ